MHVPFFLAEVIMCKIWDDSLTGDHFFDYSFLTLVFTNCQSPTSSSNQINPFASFCIGLYGIFLLITHGSREKNTGISPMATMASKRHWFSQRREGSIAGLCAWNRSAACS